MSKIKVSVITTKMDKLLTLNKKKKLTVVLKLDCWKRRLLVLLDMQIYLF